LDTEAAGNDAGNEHGHAHYGHVAGKQQCGLRRGGTERIGNRYQDRVDQADAHECDDAGEGDGEYGFGLLQHQTDSVGCVENVVASAVLSKCDRVSSAACNAKRSSTFRRAIAGATARARALRTSASNSRPCVDREMSTARASFGSGWRCTRSSSSRRCICIVMPGWVQLSARARSLIWARPCWSTSDSRRTCGNGRRVSELLLDQRFRRPMSNNSALPSAMSGVLGPLFDDFMRYE